MMKAKKILVQMCIRDRLFLAGYGVGTLIARQMKKQKQDEPAYIGRSEIKLTDGRMTPEALLSLGRLSDPQVSPDGTKILYGVSYNSIADNRSCRNLFICDIDGGNVHQLTHYAKSVSNARWSADGRSIYFLQGGQLWKAPLKGASLGKRDRLSDIPSGIGEFKISPDESRILFLSTVPGTVKTPDHSDPLLGQAEAYATESLMYRHWDHWVTETPRTYVAPFGKGIITPDVARDILGDEPYELPTEPFGGLEQLDWNPDSRHIAYSCRKKAGIDYAFSTDAEIYLYDVETDSTVCIPMEGGYDTDPVWSHDGRKLAWISMARDGYEADQQRLMVAEVRTDGATMEARDIRWISESLDADAAGIFWTPDDREIIFNALVDGLQALFRADVGSCRISRITDGDWWFDFNSPFAYRKNGGVEEFFASYCSLNFPNELVRITVDGTDGVSYAQLTDENGPILRQMAEPVCEKRYVRTVDGKDMLTWVLYPPEFDAAKQYPAIEICLGGPQGTLSQGWSYRWNYRLMAAQGFIVVMPNRRGTTAFGQEWKEEISGDYIGLNMQDYLSAAREIKAEPYVSKLAACGASYGGYSVYYLAGIHGDLYDCFIAHAGIFDERYMYYTTEEMWFPEWDNGGLGRGFLSGSPWSEFPEAKRHYANSPDVNVRNWHTPILCIHGGMDFRIPYDQGMAAFNCAQYMGVPSKLVVFPTECHWILQPQNALYWHRTYFDWLDRWMK